MKILISQIEYIKPPRNFVFDALERSYYKFLHSHELMPVPNTNKVAYNDTLVRYAYNGIIYDMLV